MAPKAKPKISGTAAAAAKGRSSATSVSKKAAGPAQKRSAPPSPPPALAVPPGPPTGALGSLLRYRGAVWRTVYSGPVLHREGRHVGLELVPPPRLAATFVPSNPTPPPNSGAAATGGTSSAQLLDPVEAHRRRTANAEAVAQALMLSLQRQYEGAGGRTDRDVALDDTESETLALADCMRDVSSRNGGFTDGVGPDGKTRYFTPSSSSVWSVLVPWADVERDQTAFEARKALSLDVLQTLAGSPELRSSQRTPSRQRSGAQSDEEGGPTAAGDQYPKASSSPLVVGSTASLIRRSQHRASREGMPPAVPPIEGDVDAPSRFVDAGESDAVARSARQRGSSVSIRTPTHPGDADDFGEGAGLCGWDVGSGGGSPEAARHGAHHGGAVAMASPLRFGDDESDASPSAAAATGNPSIPPPSRSASRVDDVDDGGDGGAVDPASGYRPRAATVSTCTQTLADTSLGWIRAATRSTDVDQPRDSNVRSGTRAKAEALNTFNDAMVSALSELRRSLSMTLTNGLLDTMTNRWSSDFAALERCAMQPPGQHPPVPGALLTSGSLELVGTLADNLSGTLPSAASVEGMIAAADDPILHEAIAAEEQRDIEAVASGLVTSLPSSPVLSDSGDAGSHRHHRPRTSEELEAELEDIERLLLRELTQRPAKAAACDEDSNAMEAAPFDDVAASGHFVALRRIARRLAEARTCARQCSKWLPDAKSSSEAAAGVSGGRRAPPAVDLEPLRATEDETDDLHAVYAALETSAGVALRPLLSFLARRPADEPMLASASQEEELVREAVARLRFDAESEADQARSCETDGDVEAYERHALDRLSLLEAAQEHVAKACESLYGPLTRTLLEVPKSTLQQVSAATKNAVQRVAGTLDAGIRAARQSRCDALAALDLDTSAFIKASYGIAREVADQKRALESVADARREAVATIVAALRTLHEGAEETAERSRVIGGLFEKRASLLEDYEGLKVLNTRRIYHAHREVLSLRCAASALEDIGVEQHQSLEAETARIMAMQRDVTERTMALHELHHETHRDVSLAAGEIQFRKSALQRRIEDRCDTVKAKLFIAQESSAPEDDTRELAATRTKLEALSGDIGETIAELDGIVDRSSASYQTLSAPPLLIAGRQLVDPRDEILERNAARQAKITAYQTDVLRITDTSARKTKTPRDDDTEAAKEDARSGVSSDHDAGVSTPQRQPTSAGEDDADEALARGLADAAGVLREAELHHTEGYNPFHSTADPHDPDALD